MYQCSHHTKRSTSKTELFGLIMLSETSFIMVTNLIKQYLGTFPIDLIKDLFILLWFQEQTGRIYESYIKDIEL